MKRLPIVIEFLVALPLLGVVLCFALLCVRIATNWAEAFQIVTLFATLVMLAVVWVQLAVQTVVGILDAAQEEGIRQVRKVLFDAEDSHHLSALLSTKDPSNQWQHDWQHAADRVSQNWNAVAYLLRIDPVGRLLISGYIDRTRRTILKSHFIAQPRIKERRDLSTGGQTDLWEDFDWLARRAASSLRDGEADAWGLTDGYVKSLKDR